VVTIPEGTVNGPERFLPRNSVFKIARSKLVVWEVVRSRRLYRFQRINLPRFIDGHKKGRR
jgi:hypothetical protein